MNYIILRPGISTPTQAEADLILRINSGTAHGSPVMPNTEMSGIITYMTSDLTKEEIAIEYQKISTIKNKDIDELEREMFPVMIFEVSETFAYNQDMYDMFGFGKMIGEGLFGISPSVESMKVKPNINNMDINQLLDLMDLRGGFDKLSKEEQTRLDKLSKEM